MWQAIWYFWAGTCAAVLWIKLHYEYQRRHFSFSDQKRIGIAKTNWKLNILHLNMPVKKTWDQQSRSDTQNSWIQKYKHQQSRIVFMRKYWFEEENGEKNVQSVIPESFQYLLEKRSFHPNDFCILNICKYLNKKKWPSVGLCWCHASKTIHISSKTYFELE